MAALKRNRATWILILLLATGFFLLREFRGNAATNASQTISVPRTFASLDGSIGEDDDGIVNNIFTKTGNLTIADGGSITCNNVGTPASACPIKLVISGNLEIQAGGAILAENQGNNGGNGGDIDITVGGDFTMRGPSGGDPGAILSSRQAGGGNGHGGNIEVIVGGVTVIPDPVNPDAPGIGVCGNPVGDALVEAGATITADAASGPAGDIALYAGRNIVIHGTVRARGFGGAGHGGAITLDACCDLLIGDTGVVSSQGQDPGADRVHLEACIVRVFGLVQSTSPAHQNPTPLCTPPNRPTKPANATACVEIWSGTSITIDATGTHKGEVHADVGFSGGSSGRGWVDILANLNIVLNDGTGNDFNNPLIPSPQTPYLVHANMGLGNGIGGLILVQSKSGSVSTFANAIQANDLAAGGDGGSVKVEAGGAACPAGNVALGTASIEARGAIHSNSMGGLIAIRSFNCDITGAAPGSLNASGSTGANPGSITLTSCIGPSYTGASNPAAVNISPVCGGSPAFPAPADTQLPAANCSSVCIVQTPTPTPTLTPTATRVQLLTPTPGGFCQKEPVLTVLNGRVPDIIVRTDLNNLTIQAAVDTATDLNSDGFIIVGVVSNANSILGGHTTQRVTVSQVYPLPFLLFGCSVTMHDPNKADGLPTGLITAAANSPGNIFIMDLHGADSEVAGWKIEGSGRTVRNTGGSNSATGIWFSGSNNLMHNGAASGNSGVGLLIQGPGNTATDTDAFDNGSHGVQVVGNSNQLLKIDSGEIGKGNGGDGINLSGSSNLLKENTTRSNTLDGIRILAGTGNTLTKNGSGGTPSQNNGGCEFEVTGGNTNGGENKANGVVVVGNPFPTGCI